jgi:predicted transcriptional regulator
VRPDIPRHVQAFVARHLPSVGHLETLLWTREHRSRWWTADALASYVNVSTAAAEKILEELCSGSLLAVQASSKIAYRFSPATPDLDALVDDFVDTLRQSRPRVFELISSHASRSDLADARG